MYTCRLGFFFFLGKTIAWNITNFYMHMKMWDNFVSCININIFLQQNNKKRMQHWNVWMVHDLIDLIKNAYHFYFQWKWIMVYCNKNTRIKKTLMAAYLMVSRYWVALCATAALMSSTEPIRRQKACARAVWITWLFCSPSVSRNLASTVTFSTVKQNLFHFITFQTLLF